MSEPLQGVVVCHGDLAKALVAAVEEISGIHGVLTPITNTGADRTVLESRVAAAADGQPTVIFVDLPSGSCLFAAMRRLASHERVRVVTGVNLAMLLEFTFHRDLGLDAATARVLEAGARAIGGR